MQKFEISINENSRIPKYKQIIDSIIENVAKGKLSVGDKVPSINELSESSYLSRDTVKKAYLKLKQQKIIVPVKSKGFYIARTDLILKTKVFFMVNKASPYKMMIYNSFIDTIGINSNVNLYIYHGNDSLFIRYIEKNLGVYDYYVIMPHFKNEHQQHISSTPNVLKTIEKIPKEKLIVLDNSKPEIKGRYISVYQDFKADIFEALTEASEKLKKYDKLILVFPTKSVFPHPLPILHGFRHFCIQNNFDFEILDEIYEDMELQTRDTYIVLKESDLVNLVQQILSKDLKVGRDIGVISYNETPLKELLDITVISTDFKNMGETAAHMILKNKKEKVKNVFKYIERNSV